MGFRTTMITEDTGLFIPDEFLEEYPYCIAKKSADGRHRLTLAILREIKFYNDFTDTELFIDLQKLMIEQNFSSDISIILLHECGGISKVEITKEKIIGFEPTQWKKVEGVEHDYCYGCTSSKNLTS